MEIKYSPDYQQGATKFIAIHNTGGLGIDARASTMHLTPDQIDRAHKDRFSMFSSLGRWGGYNFYIESNGNITQFRAIGEETAAQKGHNFNGEAISICLAGNFTQGVDTPTEEQKNALLSLYGYLPKVPAWNVLPHRLLQTGTSCYGSSLADDWARNLLSSDKSEVARLQTIISLLTKLLDLMRQAKARGLSGMIFGSVLHNCGQTDVRG